MDALASFDAPVVRFRLMGPGQRAMVTGHATREDAAGPAEGAHQHLLMSVKPLM